MEAKKSFMDASTSGSKDKPEPEMDLSMITTFLETCMKLLRDRKSMKGPQELITRCARTTLGESRVVWKIGKHTTRIGREMRLTMQIGEYEMDQLILDLGSDTNVLPKKTWEHMSRPALQWSPIQLRMENQQKIPPMERLQGITIDIEDVSTLAVFEVIKIVDDINPYLALLGIDWATDMNEVINIKKHKMIFEKKSLHIVVSLDLVEGSLYIEPVHDYVSHDDLDCIYKITM